MSDTNLEKLFSSDEQSILNEFVELCQQGILGTLSSMLGQEFVPKQPDITVVSDITQFTQTVASSGGISACLEMTARATTPFVFFMDQATGGNIANILMGLPIDEAIAEVNEIQISASGEVISQMMGAISNSASQLFSQKVDVTPPQVALYSEDVVQNEISNLSNGQIVQVLYTFESTGTLPLVAIYQLIPEQDLKELVNSILKIKNPEQAQTTTKAEPAGTSSGKENQSSVTVQPIQFAPINQGVTPPPVSNANFELVQDILLRMSVELGRSELTIRDVLDLTRGSVIELDRIAGESVDLMANGKLIARGEIVVIEDNFGFRVTSIVSPQERLSAV